MNNEYITEMLNRFKMMLEWPLNNADDLDRFCNSFNAEIERFEKLKESYDKASIKQIVLKCKEKYESHLKIFRATENKKGFKLV